MKKILVPTDFTSLSDNALWYACQMSDKIQSEIYLLTIQSLPASDDANMAIELIRTIQEASEEKLKLLKAKVNERFPGVNVTTHFGFGIPSLTVKDYLESGEFDLVIMGSLGSTGIDRFLFGSVAEAISKHSPCPVLILHENTSYKPLQKLAVAIDINYNFKESYNVIQRIIDFASGIGANVKWFYVNKKNKEPESEDIHFSIDNEKTIIIETINSENVESGIGTYCKKNNPDLLILLKRDYGLVEQLFHHSVFSEVLHQQSLPIMVIHY
jgi:nucleotide-binding universal stress UspA family protein